MIDDVLRADAQRWNAAHRPVPDLDEAINRLDRRPGASRSRRVVLSGLAAASVVAAAAAVVIVSASVGQGRHSVPVGTTPRSPLAAAPTHTVTRPVTFTVTKTIVAQLSTPVDVTQPHVALGTVTLTQDIAQQGSDTSTTSVTQTQRVEVAPVRAKPVVGHTRALLASIGLFIAIAGAWGLGRAQRRRAH